MIKINPSLKTWRIYFFILVATQAYAQQTPQQRLGQFFTWVSKTEQVPEENDCFEMDGYDISKIDDKCLQKYLANIQKTGFFSSIYMKNLKAEFTTMKATLKKEGMAQSREADRYLLSQDPPTMVQLLYALKTSSTSKIEANKAKVTVNIKKPYKQTLIYNFDLEENIWKISSIESPQ